jgi:DNA polymerase III delta prime subunit
MADQVQKIKPIFVVGPPSSGKSHYIQELARREGRTLLSCPCRKDRTLREQRAVIHEWALRAEPTLLWIEGTDDLTPEAQSFLRRILETYAPSVRFCLEAQSLESIQEPILSRCEIIRCVPATETELYTHFGKKYTTQILNDIFARTSKKTYRQLEIAATLATSYPNIWMHLGRVQSEQALLTDADHSMKLYTAAKNPWDILLAKFDTYSYDSQKLLIDCIAKNGNPWAALCYIQLRK